MIFVENTAASVNNSNILTFFEKVSQDPALQTKLRQIAEEHPDQAAAKTVALSEEIGIPITVEELTALKKASTETKVELSATELESIAGGGIKDDAMEYVGNIARKAVPYLLQII